MKALASSWFATVVLTVGVLAADPLPSWNDTAPKQALLAFVNQVTTEGGPHYVPPSGRIAVFDNDGTLWCEQPMYVQLRFALDRVKALAPQHPEWKRQQPFKRLLSTPRDQRVAVTEAELMELLMVTHAGMTTEAFEQIVRDWIGTATHPTTGRRYTDMVYQPMQAGKPVGIQQHIGRRPVLAFGNSDGDFEMLEWTTAGASARLGLLVHHDDAEREFAYDRDSSVGKLARGLDEGPRRGWTLVSIKADWRRVYPADP